MIDLRSSLRIRHAAARLPCRGHRHRIIGGLAKHHESKARATELDDDDDRLQRHK